MEDISFGSLSAQGTSSSAFPSCSLSLKSTTSSSPKIVHQSNPGTGYQIITPPSTIGHHSSTKPHHHHKSSSTSSAGRAQSKQKSSGGSSPSKSQISQQQQKQQLIIDHQQQVAALNLINMHHHKTSSASSHGQQQLYTTSASSVAFPTSQRVVNGQLGQQQTMILQRQGNNGNLVPTSIQSIAFPSFNHHQQNVQLLQVPILNMTAVTQQQQQSGSSSPSKGQSRNQVANQQMIQIQQLQQINNGTGNTITLSSIGGQSVVAAAALQGNHDASAVVKKPKKKYPKKKAETPAYNPYSDATADFSPHCPKAWNRKVTGQVFCRGCGKGFLKYSNGLYEKGYYVHCIKECREYRDLDMVKSCHDCRHLFINKKSFSQHPCEKAKKKELKNMGQ